jgi:hypothetical protein
MALNRRPDGRADHHDNQDCNDQTSAWVHSGTAITLTISVAKRNRII